MRRPIRGSARHASTRRSSERSSVRSTEDIDDDVHRHGRNANIKVTVWPLFVSPLDELHVLRFMIVARLLSAAGSGFFSCSLDVLPSAVNSPA